MSERELHNEHEHEVVHEEDEHLTGDIHEQHVIRQEAYGPARDIRDREVVRDVVAPSKTSYPSGLEREEVVRAHEDKWLFTVRVLRFVGLWVGVVLAVMEALMAFRLIFLMAAANPGAGFIAFVYGSTSWMVAPFQGIARNGLIQGGGIFEPATLIAMLVYPVLALLIIIFLRTVAASPRIDYDFFRRATRRRTY